MAVHAYILCYSRDTTLAPEKRFRGILKGLSSAPSHLNVPSPPPPSLASTTFWEVLFPCIVFSAPGSRGHSET